MIHPTPSPHLSPGDALLLLVALVYLILGWRKFGPSRRSSRW